MVYVPEEPVIPGGPPGRGRKVLRTMSTGKDRTVTGCVPGEGGVERPGSGPSGHWHFRSREDPVSAMNAVRHVA